MFLAELGKFGLKSSECLAACNFPKYLRSFPIPETLLQSAMPQSRAYQTIEKSTRLFLPPGILHIQFPVSAAAIAVAVGTAHARQVLRCVVRFHVLDEIMGTP